LDENIRGFAQQCVASVAGNDFAADLKKHRNG
jgi:hypothetical protein